MSDAHKLSPSQLATLDYFALSLAFYTRIEHLTEDEEDEILARLDDLWRRLDSALEDLVWSKALQVIQNVAEGSEPADDTDWPVPPEEAPRAWEAADAAWKRANPDGGEQAERVAWKGAFVDGWIEATGASRRSATSKLGAASE